MVMVTSVNKSVTTNIKITKALPINQAKLSLNTSMRTTSKLIAINLAKIFRG
jgi:hypothetical protein